MASELKSVRFDVLLSAQYDSTQICEHVEWAANQLDIYISHIGSYSRKKYPNSIHWHFKRQPKEKGCLDATFWKEEKIFWIVARNYEPQWVKDKALDLQALLSAKL